ncbi:MAG: tRNA(5-methylaminomethyl-2-thiouridylate) methyltransferase [Desulfovibrionaceae bacterium]|nr:tRNA(5-methylaminomethyl-2-thiouridylate) methyltransferase [Desulfovibrionaceae bacterium]
MKKTDAIVLFSGGLDSILCAKMLLAQNLSVLCLHFSSPFFGNPEKIPLWEERYGLSIEHKDVSKAFVQILKKPRFGYGKRLNPCVDCKILLLASARAVLEEKGASILATGEVLGQRPMSQRSDCLNRIAREANVTDVLLRPLSAQLLPETRFEKQGLIDRSRLAGIAGRGRSQQLRLAHDFGIDDIPMPNGGCSLTEEENARRYWPVLTLEPHAGPLDFLLTHAGRQFWQKRDGQSFWLTIGRHERDNAKLQNSMQEDDALLSFPAIPSPLAIARHGASWPKECLLSGASLALSYAVRAIAQNPIQTVRVLTRDGAWETSCTADRGGEWTLPPWESVSCELHKLKKTNSEAS